MMNNCTKYDSCSAPVCPLDPEWKNIHHLKGERVCFYLTEYSKPAARPILQGLLTAEMYQVIVSQYPEIISTSGTLKKQLTRSSINPPRVGQLPGRSAA